jgi:hypothetical protein
MPEITAKPKRKAPTPLKGRTMAALKKDGYLVADVERLIRFPGMKFMRRVDLFGIADVLAAKDGEPPLLVQCTSLANGSIHLKKLCAEPNTQALLRMGWNIEIWTWAQRGDRGKRKTWGAKQRAVTLDDVEDFKAGRELRDI